LHEWHVLDVVEHVTHPSISLHGLQVRGLSKKYPLKHCWHVAIPPILLQLSGWLAAKSLRQTFNLHLSFSQNGM